MVISMLQKKRKKSGLMHTEFPLNKFLCNNNYFHNLFPGHWGSPQRSQRKRHLDHAKKEKDILRPKMGTNSTGRMEREPGMQPLPTWPMCSLVGTNLANLTVVTTNSAYHMPQNALGHPGQQLNKLPTDTEIMFIASSMLQKSIIPTLQNDSEAACAVSASQIKHPSD